MNIEGLDYNTQREKLTLPEYGRQVLSMVKQACAMTDRNARQAYAEHIVNVMGSLSTQGRDSYQFEQKLWDHLARMSNYELDVDYPYEINRITVDDTKPNPIGYPKRPNPIRHYGAYVFELIEKLKEMPMGEARDALARMTANTMKRDLMLWGHGSHDDEKVFSDLASLSDGTVQLDPATFRFDKIDISHMGEPEKKGKRK